MNSEDIDSHPRHTCLEQLIDFLDAEAERVLQAARDVAAMALPPAGTRGDESCSPGARRHRCFPRTPTHRAVRTRMQH